MSTDLQHGALAQPTVRFCYGCNMRFEQSAQRCPSCGQTLDELTENDLQNWLDATTLDALSRAAAEAGTQSDELVGSLLESYEVERVAGEGGMARVYKARHLHLGRPCALKVLNQDLATRLPEYAEMFVAEARSAAALIHPNIVTVHNILKSGNLHLIEMEWVHGPTAADLVRDDRRIEPAQATELMVQVCSGLAIAHSEGVVHRDVKPSNVLIDDRGTAKLADFGLAKRVVSRHRREQAAGTPYYMAPELFRGRSSSPASDVYAAGVTFYVLLTGELPFRGRSLNQVIRRHHQTPPRDPRLLAPHVPDKAVSIVARAMSKRPEERYQNAGELLEPLLELLGAIRDLPTLVRASLADEKVEILEQENGDLEVDVKLDGGRSQSVFVEDTLSELGGGEHLLKIYSPCAPVDDSYLRRALELNSEVHHGALAIQDHDGRPYFVMRNNYPRATCDPEELRQSVLTIAQAADDVEAALLGDDRH